MKKSELKSIIKEVINESSNWEMVDDIESAVIYMDGHGKFKVEKDDGAEKVFKDLISAFKWAGR